MIEFKDNYIDNNLKDVVIKKNDKKLEITYGGNLDLYFNIFGKDTEVCGMDYVNKKIDVLLNEQDEAYKYFDTLIKDIESDKHKSLLVRNGSIVWYSDDTYEEAADILSIYREGSNIRIVFYNNPNELHFGIPVRISNSGSRYEPLNVHFMTMYKDLQSLAKERCEGYSLEKKLY